MKNFDDVEIKDLVKKIILKVYGKICILKKNKIFTKKIVLIKIKRFGIGSGYYPLITVP